jgi:hypothetical protein
MKPGLRAVLFGFLAASLLYASSVSKLLIDDICTHMPSLDLRGGHIMILCMAGSLTTLIAYERMLRAKPTQCRCRKCHGILRNLDKPVCPQCGTRI